MLRKSPGFTAVAVLTLALGIGANTAIFSFIDAVLLRDLPVKNPQQLVLMRWTAHAKPKNHGFSGYGDCIDNKCSFSLPFFHTIDAQATAFSGMAAFAGSLDVDLDGNGAASIAHGMYVSGDFFSTLGVNTFIGRPLTPSDDTPSAPPAIVLNYAYWALAFGANPSVIGRTVRLDNTDATIVGVADPHFTNLTPGNTQDFFMPFALSDRVRGEWWGNQTRMTDASIWWVIILGRLKPGVSIGQAQAAATTISNNEMLHGSTPVFKAADAPMIKLLPASAGLNGESSRIAPMLFLIMAAVGFVLLIVCANVAGLTLARSASRQKEMAVRLALGAGRPRIIRQLLTESILLSLTGGALGILLAVWGVDAITSLLSSGYSFSVRSRVGLARTRLHHRHHPGYGDLLRPCARVAQLTHRSHAFAQGKRLFSSGRRGTCGPTLPSRRRARRRASRALHCRPNRRGTSRAHATQSSQHQSWLRHAQRSALRHRSHHRWIHRPANATALQQFAAAFRRASRRDFRQLFRRSALERRPIRHRVHFDRAPPRHVTSTFSVGLNFFSTMRIPILAGRTFTPADFATAIATNAAQTSPGRCCGRKNSASPALVASYASAQQAYAHSSPVPVLINESFARKFLGKAKSRRPAHGRRSGQRR